MQSVYIIGTRHHYQTGVELKASQTEKFAQMLCESIQTYKVAGVGEEMCLPVLKKLNVEATVPYLVCGKLGVEHKYCDPDARTKAEHGIKTSTEREQFWIAQLKGFHSFPVLFICGAMHCRTFAKLLESSGFSSHILYSNWPHR